MLVCGAEALSRVTDHDDRGDRGALRRRRRRRRRRAPATLELGVGGFVLGADGAQADLLYAERDERMLRMQGREVYRHAVARMAEASREALERAGLTSTTSTSSSPTRPTRASSRRPPPSSASPREKVVLNVDRVANTSSASIPLALAQAEREGRLQPGDTVALAAFGAGFVWGAGIVSWKERVHVCA